MAKTKAELEQEYQDVLKVSSSLLKDIKTTITDTGKEMKGMSSAEAKFQENLKKSLDGLEDKSDITKAILKQEAAFKKLASDKRRTENGSLTNARALKDVAIQTLRTEENKINAIEAADAASQEFASNLNEQLDSIVDGLGPFGALLRGPIDGMKESINDAAMVFTTQFASSLRGGAGGFEALRAAGGKSLGFLRAAINPVTLAIVAIGAAIMAGVKAFTAIDEAARKFREETGLLNANTEQTAANIAKVKTDTAGIGASFEDVAQAAADFTNEFRGIEQPSAEVLKSLVILNKNFGIATSEAAQVNGIFQDISGASQEAAQALTAQTVELANQVGVAPSQVIKDIAENAETAAIFFGGSAKELASAAIEAAALGTSLTEAAKVSEGLLDFENSITAELEASAMLGQSINFNKARELAATGDILGAQQSVLDNLSENVNLNELNTFQLQSIAKASGMEVGELQKQLNIRKQFGPINAQQQAALDRLAAKGNEITSISKAQLAEETKSVIKQQELQGRLEAIGNQFSAIGTNLMMAFAPLAEIILPIFSVIGSVIGTIGTGLGVMVDFIKKAKAPLGVLVGLFALFKINAIIGAIGAIFTGLGAIPFVGPALAFAAVAGLMGLIANAQSVGDMASEAGGVTRVSTAEGGLFELSPNDDFAAAPGLLSGGGGGGAGAIVSAIEQLGNDIRDLQFVVNMDGAKVAEGVTKVNSRSNANTFGASV